MSLVILLPAPSIGISELSGTGTVLAILCQLLHIYRSGATMIGLCAVQNPFRHLVIVCGHSTYKGEGDPRDEASWVLEPFRQSNSVTGKPSEHYTFVQHILVGIEILKADPTALLVFSGGRTQNEIPQTEAESYRQAFLKLGDGADAYRTAVETDATDSFQNLLFSVLAFRRAAGLYPSNITIITHAFKERRFLNCHGPAIRWPADRIRTVGINPPFTLQELNQVHWGENENAFKHFISDPYGVKAPLSDKRKARNWNHDTMNRLLLDECIDSDVKALLTWQGGPQAKDIYNGPLPWA